MAQQLGQVSVGTLVKLNESGSPANYIVVHQGLPDSMYDASCDGTWVLRQDIYENRQWNSSNSNSYKASTIHTYLNGTFLNLFDADIREVIKQVKIPYVNGTADAAVASGSSGLSCKIFLLSGREVGFSTSDNQYFPNDGAKLSYFESGTGSSALNKRIANLDGSAAIWWLRSPSTSRTTNAWSVNANGSNSSGNCSNPRGIRPALVLPSNLLVSDDGIVAVPPNPPATITVPIQAMQGQPIAISWPAVEGADGYILERSADSGAWTQVYSGANLSYTDTAGSWTSVQYRVKAGLDGNYGDYKTSASVPVAAASALVISGTDGSLGTVTADVAYSVSSDTGNQISLNVTVNGAEWLNSQVSSVYDGVLPVMELPGGDGSIVIKASVQATSGEVSVTRSWTYSKTAISFPAAAQVGVLQQGGQNFLPATLAELVRTNPFWGGSLDKALELLKNSVQFYPVQTPKYQEVIVDLSTAQEGDIVRLPENGVLVDFYVAKLNYESGLNGAGRVLLVRKDCYDNRMWDASNANIYVISDIDNWFNETYKALLSQDVQMAMGTTKFYCTHGSGNQTVEEIERAVFALSATELGQSESWFNVEGSALPIANTLKVAYLNGSANTQWTRSPHTNYNDRAVCLDTKGNVGSNDCNTTYGSRPAFTLPSTFSATYYVDSSGNLHDEQEYESAGSTTDVQGNPITIGTQIATGSYVGTGTYGSSNPNTLTFEFEPKILFVSLLDTQNAYTGVLTIVAGSGGAISDGVYNSNTNGGVHGVFVTTQGTTISWYNGGMADNQANRSGKTYTYVAIG